MPDAGTPDADSTELTELRVLDGPNRFFSRPAVKVEFAAEEPGLAAGAATRAGEAVRALYTALELQPPRLTFRRSADDLRAGSHSRGGGAPSARRSAAQRRDRPGSEHAAP